MEGTKFIFKIKQNFIHIPFKIQIAICQLTCDMAAVYYIFNEQPVWSGERKRELLPALPLPFQADIVLRILDGANRLQ